MRLEAFWEQASRAKLATRFSLADELELLAHVPSRALRDILFQYRFFTLAFTPDLAALVARCPPSGLRSLLGEVLNDELGNGNEDKAHPALFDRFLASIGALGPDDAESALQSRMHPEVRTLLEELEQTVARSSLSYAVGLRGVGGECVCGVYFIEMYGRMAHHPLIIHRRDQIDWEFWDIHAGHADIEHDVATRAAVKKLLDDGMLDADEIYAGFEHGVRSWDRFWRALFETHVGPGLTADSKRVTRRRTLHAPAKLRSPRGRHGAVVINISESGALIETGAALTQGDQIVLEVAEGSSTVFADALVSRATTVDHNRFGLRFIDFRGEAG